MFCQWWMWRGFICFCTKQSVIQGDKPPATAGGATINDSLKTKTLQFVRCRTCWMMNLLQRTLSQNGKSLKKKEWIHQPRRRRERLDVEVQHGFIIQSSGGVGTCEQILRCGGAEVVVITDDNKFNQRRLGGGGTCGAYIQIYWNIYIWDRKSPTLKNNFITEYTSW